MASLGIIGYGPPSTVAPTVAPVLVKVTLSIASLPWRPVDENSAPVKVLTLPKGLLALSAVIVSGAGETIRLPLV